MNAKRAGCRETLRLFSFFVALIWVLMLGENASAQVTSDDDREAATLAVRLNDRTVSERTVVYFDSSGTIFVSSQDVIAWHLRKPLQPSFVSDAIEYYGLQTDLNLAVSVDRYARQLDITVPPAMLMGAEPPPAPQPDPGAGLRFGYAVRPFSGSYDVTDSRGSSQLHLGYVSAQNSQGMRFLPSVLKWTKYEPGSSVLSLGDGTADGGWVGSSVPFAGLHWATDYASDPEFDPHELPRVSGFAAAPSRLDLYVDNLLYLREDVDQGVFEIDNLPLTAVHSDVIAILTDANGRKTQLVLQPAYDEDFLRPKLTTFGVDFGLGHHNLDAPQAYFTGGVLSANLKRGVTRRFTAIAHAESIECVTFASLGGDYRVGTGQIAGFQYGDGRNRHAEEIRYEVNSGKLSFKELLHVNSERTVSDLYPEYVDSTAREERELQYQMSRRLSFAIRLERSVTTSGSVSSFVQGRARYRTSRFSLDLKPTWDASHHRIGALLSVAPEIGGPFRPSIASEITRTGQYTTYAELDKQRTSPLDPTDIKIRDSEGDSQSRALEISEFFPGFAVKAQAQDQFGMSQTSWELSGNVEAVHGRAYAIRELADTDAMAIIRAPGFTGAHVFVNGAPAGDLDRRGELLLRDLSSFRRNAVKLVIPAEVNGGPYQAEYTVVPLGGATVNLQIAEVRVGTSEKRGMIFVSSDGRRFMTGPHGELYVIGLGAGRQTLTAVGDGSSCTIAVDIPNTRRGLSISPDVGCSSR